MIAKELAMYPPIVDKTTIIKAKPKKNFFTCKSQTNQFNYHKDESKNDSGNKLLIPC